jgi:hypothetical protein
MIQMKLIIYPDPIDIFVAVPFTFHNDEGF